MPWMGPILVASDAEVLTGTESMYNPFDRPSDEEVVDAIPRDRSRSVQIKMEDAIAEYQADLRNEQAEVAVQTPLVRKRWKTKDGTFQVKRKQVVDDDPSVDPQDQMDESSSFFFSNAARTITALTVMRSGRKLRDLDNVGSLSKQKNG